LFFFCLLVVLVAALGAWGAVVALVALVTPGALALHHLSSYVFYFFFV